MTSVVLERIADGVFVALLLRGLLAIAFGVVSWVMPGLSLAALLLLFGSYSLVDGVFSVWNAIAGRRDHEHWC